MRAATENSRIITSASPSKFHDQDSSPNKSSSIGLRVIEVDENLERTPDGGLEDMYASEPKGDEPT